MVHALPDQFEERIKRLASDFPFPPAPDLSDQVTAGITARRQPYHWHKLARAALVVLILLAGIAMLVPTVRAAVLEFLQIGGLRIFLQTPTPENPAFWPGSGESRVPYGSAPVPSQTALPSLFSTLNLSGETSLEAASQEWGAPFLLPGPRSGLGEPDRVLIQRWEGTVMVSLWLDPADEGRLLASLMILKPGAFVSKDPPGSIENTQVRGLPGFWLQGEHHLILESAGNSQSNMTINGQNAVFIQVLGNVLVWEEDGSTYRLESFYDLEQSQAIAESMQPYP